MHLSPVISIRSTIPDVFNYWCNERPEELLASDASGSITYSQAKQQVDAFSQVLLNKGIEKGDRVCVLSPPNIHFLISFLGTVQIGAIWVGLNPKYTHREIKHIVEDTSTKLIFVHNQNSDSSCSSLLKSLKPEADIISFSNESNNIFKPYDSCITEKSNIQQKQPIYAQDPACIIYTSGTTGAPKGALIPHFGLTKTSAIQNRLLQHPYPRLLNNLPINHIGCLGDLTFYALCGGGFIAFQEKFDAEGCLALIEQHKLTLWGQVPTMFQLSLNALKNTSYDLTSLSTILFSGAPASQDLITQLRCICPNVVNAYGMTETVGSVTWAINCPDDILVTTIGYPIDDYNIRIASPEGDTIIAGDVGEIQVQGDFHMLGYWQNEEATNDAFTNDGWLKTGDLATENTDGSYKLTGRIKEMFKSGGYNVYPLEIEQVLETLPSIKKAIIICVPDSLYNEVGYAFIQPNEQVDLSSENLKNYCSKHLANYKVPKYFNQISELPYLPNGKIDKGKLKKMAHNAINNRNSINEK